MTATPQGHTGEFARAGLDSLAGDAASAKALARLKQASVATRKALGPTAKQVTRDRKVVALLRVALEHIAAGRFADAVRTALSALDLDDRNGLAWHVMAIAQEKHGDLQQAFSAYDAALRLLPEDGAVAHDLGRLAHRLGELVIAEKLLAHVLVGDPGNIEATNNLACVLRDRNRYDDAVDLLRNLIGIHPGDPVLWNTLGTVLSEKGDPGGSVVFYDEALRLDPGFYKARYNRANVRMNMGHPNIALTDIEQALTGVDDPHEIATMKMAKALTQLMVGDLKAGFATYEVRFDPALPDAVAFQDLGQRWTPDADLSGRTLLVFGEQGLGDEVLFANVLGDVVAALGDGHLVLAVERRLIPLFQRSYPTATVVAHRSVRHMGRLVRMLDQPLDRDIDLWAPIGRLFARFRTGLDAFPTTPAFLRADPDRVTYWRGVLDAQGPGLKVGVLWKSLQMTGSRVRAFSPFEQWQGVLSVPGVRFVNLQYGDASAELEAARAAGLDIWTPPGIDLKTDLDDLAALCVALDTVIGPATATTNIAAAAGAQVWCIATPEGWTRFGTDGQPCYPTLRVFQAEAVGEWTAVMDRIAKTLSHDAARRHAA